jgi:hypothetical protein
MRKNSRWLFAQANNHYRDYNVDYLFLFSKAKKSGNVVWDVTGGEWELDGIGHSTFRLELIC